MHARMKEFMALPLAFAMIVACNARAIAEKTTLGCPAALLVAPAAAAAPEGWSASRRAKEEESEKAFASAAFTIGHPDELGFLRPSGESSADGMMVDEFDLASIPAASGVWLICSYENTPVFVYRKLEANPAKCSVPQKGASAERAAVCE